MEIVEFKTSEVEQVFEKEKAKLIKIFPNIQIEHIGGTSVPGLITKGDLDINIRVQKDDFPTVVEKLKSIYQINQPENWTETYASFKDTIDGIDFGAQVTAVDSPEDYFLKHRDFLRTHPEVVEKFNQLKKKWEGKDMAEYRKEKSEFFEKLTS